MNNFQSEQRKPRSSSTMHVPSTWHPAPAPQEPDLTGLHAVHSLADFAVHSGGESGPADPVQKMDATYAHGQADRAEQVTSEERYENRTGLPDALKAGVESLSGYSLDDIRVHYNSPKPAEVQALAYTQGTEIHVGPGQEQHLAHEAWHVVQQKQGRVQPTMQMKGLAINDDVGLEREADVMGEKAALQSASLSHDDLGQVTSSPAAIVQLLLAKDIQPNKRYKYKDKEGKVKEGVLLEKKSGGWYSFDNGDVIQGAGNIIEEAGSGRATLMEIEGEDHGSKSEVSESDSESDEEKEMEKEETTIRSMFLNYINSKGIKKQSTINLLVDLNAENIKLAKEVRKLRNYKTNWQAYTSCFDAAERLFNLLGDPKNFATNSWSSVVQLTEGIKVLIQDIEQINSSKVGCIYRIGIERASSLDHSFVIAIQSGNAELLQSFAGADGEALGQNLQKNGSYTVEKIKLLLSQLIDSKDNVRAQSQEALFGGRIDGERDPKDPKKVITLDLRSKDFGIKIDRRGLYDQDVLEKRIKEKIARNMQELGLIQS